MALQALGLQGSTQCGVLQCAREPQGLETPGTKPLVAWNRTDLSKSFGGPQRHAISTSNFSMASGSLANKRVIAAHSAEGPSSEDSQHEGDPELRGALELASDEELHELVDILYGRSPLSPVMKSITSGDGARKGRQKARAGGSPALSEREILVRRLEARFFFLAADAKSTIIGSRPSYREVLLSVRSKLQVPCPTKLSTQDLEAEIFLHLLQEYSSEPSRKAQHEQGIVVANEPPKLKTRSWRQKILAPVVLGSQDVLEMLAKGSSALGVTTLQRMALERLTGRVLHEAARYQLAAEALRKGGAAMAAKLESHYAVLAARQGLKSAAARYTVLRSTMTLLGPVMWGAFLADMALRSLGTDYGRVVRTIFALAQIRLTRTYGWSEAEAQG